MAYFLTRIVYRSRYTLITRLTHDYDISVDYKLLGFLCALFRNGTRDLAGDIHSTCVHSTWTHPGACSEGLLRGASFTQFV